LFVVAGGDAAPLLEAVEAAFDDVRRRYKDLSKPQGRSRRRRRPASWSTRSGMVALIPRLRRYARKVRAE
jgi:hypothetical protein